MFYEVFFTALALWGLKSDLMICFLSVMLFGCLERFETSRSRLLEHNLAI